MISGIESSKDNPQAVAGNVFNARLYGKDHPYGENATVESVNAVDLDDCKTYYSNYWIPNATYLAIVGDVKAKDVKKLAKKHFGDWKPGNKPESTYPTPTKPDGLAISFINKESAIQSVLVMGNTINLKPGDPDEVKMALTNEILGAGAQGRLFLNIREDKGYTYGAYSNYDSDRLIGEFTANASVRNEVTDSAVTEFMKEFNRIRTEPATDEEIRGAKNAVIGSFGRALERPQTIANFALNINRFNLPEDYYETYLPRLEKLTKEEFSWLRTYFRREVYPVLTPLAIDPTHPFPLILNKSLNLQTLNMIIILYQMFYIQYHKLNQGKYSLSMSLSATAD